MDYSWIRQVREDKGLSLQDVSRRSGVSVSYLSEIERGTKQPAAKTVEKLTSALGISREQVTKNTGGSEIGIGQKIRIVREERGISLTELARFAGISVSYLSEIERDVVKPGVETLKALAENLNVTIPQLMGSMTTIAKRLRSVREQFGLTQAEVAERAGVSPGLIGQIEQGKVQPSLRTIERVAEVLGVTPCYFLVPQPSLETLLPVLSEDLIGLLSEPQIQSTLRLIYDLNEDELRFVFGIIRLLKQTKTLQGQQPVNEESYLAAIETDSLAE